MAKEAKEGKTKEKRKKKVEEAQVQGSPKKRAKNSGDERNLKQEPGVLNWEVAWRGVGASLGYEACFDRRSPRRWARSLRATSSMRSRHARIPKCL